MNYRVDGPAYILLQASWKVTGSQDSATAPETFDSEAEAVARPCDCPTLCSHQIARDFYRLNPELRKRTDA